MKEYDLIVIGSGSAIGIVEAWLQQNPRMKIAVIDKDEPGGICLTRGCIPSKILLYSAELVRTIERAGEFGIATTIEKRDFGKVMQRMRSIIDSEINAIRNGLSHSRNIDFYPTVAEFTAPYTLRTGNETMTSKMIFLCAGSRPIIPQVEGLESVGYLTSDTLLRLTELPQSLVVIGGGYIAAEYGHFFAAMGSKVTIIGRNPQFLPEEEPEISALAKRELQKHMTIITNHEVGKAEKAQKGEKTLLAINRDTKKTVSIKAREILVASGRGATTDILHPEKSGINVDARGFIEVNDYFETSQPGIWAFGDADGRFLFKHVANYEAQIVYYNVVQKRRLKADYHAVPHAVFMYPEIASVGIKEKEAIEKHGKNNVLIGIHRYEDTAKGQAINAKDYFAKVIVERGTSRILGAHIIGPHASILIHEIINVMYTSEQNTRPIIDAMHIHPALSEVVQKAFDELMTPDQYHHLMQEHYGLLTE